MRRGLPSSGRRRILGAASALCLSAFAQPAWSQATPGIVIDLDGGTVPVAVSGTEGDDVVNWTGGVFELGFSLLGGNDQAFLTNLGPANLASGSPYSAGRGNDRLVLSGVTADGLGRFQDWETVELTNGTRFAPVGPMVLGDLGSSAGALSIDATSTLLAGRGIHTIAAFAPGRAAIVRNAGVLDLTNGPPAIGDVLAIQGDYVGGGGRLLLQTVLAGDDAPTDRLVIADGAATGTTAIFVTNLGGSGALTVGDGILVVDVVIGTSTPDAFTLDGVVAAGPFEYRLFRGGAAPDSESDWFLRSSAVTPSGAAPLPLFRPEVAVYAAAPGVARSLTLTTLGAFMDRQGDPARPDSDADAGAAPAVWARVFGQDAELGWGGQPAPEFDGGVAGLQAGLEPFQRQSASGHVDRLGVLVGFARADGDVRGFVAGQADAPAGDLDLEATSVGAYWTRVAPAGWYVDAVAMGSWFDADLRSDRADGFDGEGDGFTASLEGGRRFRLGANTSVVPQAQLVWQSLSFDSGADAVSEVRFDPDETLSGRLGARLESRVERAGALWRPYVTADLWRQFEGEDVVAFPVTPVVTRFGGTAVGVGAGVTGQVTPALGLYAEVGYLGEVSDQKQEIVSGDFGLRLRW